MSDETRPVDVNEEGEQVETTQTLDPKTEDK